MQKFLLGFVVAVAFGSIQGCSNIGGAPEGASADEMKATFDKLPVDDRAKMLIQSPGPLTEEKKSKVKAMYEKEGKPIPAEIEKMMGGTGTGH